MYIISKIKNYIVSDLPKERTVLFGIYRGLKLEINLRDKLQVYLGLWERETYPYINRSFKKSNWFIDIGSGDGELCILFLKSTLVSKVYAFDPLINSTDQMKNDMLRNGISKDSRLIVSNKLVGNNQNENYIKMDNIEVDYNKNGFIKIDVEGSELDVLESGKSLLNYDKVDLLIETHSKQLEDECITYLRNLNYNTQIIYNAWWRILVPEYRPTGHNRWLWASKS